MSLQRISAAHVALSACLIFNSSCKLRRPSPVAEAKIINGTVIGQSTHPAVVMLDNGCTGTWIGSRTLLTAAHCVDSAPTTSISVGANVDVSKRIMYPKEWRPEDKSAVHDIAIVLFAEGAAERSGASSPLVLATESSQPDDSVTLVGYGCDAWESGTALNETTRKSCQGRGVKRSGRNEVSMNNGKTLTILPTTRSGAVGALNAPGDSGGPLLNERGEVIGVCARGDGTFGRYASITSPMTQAFLRSVISCGKGPCAEPMALIP